VQEVVEYRFKMSLVYNVLVFSCCSLC